MGNLTGTWIIERAQPNIGLFGKSNKPRSVFRIDIDETEVTALNNVEWGSGSAWTLAPADVQNQPEIEKRALVLVNEVPHWAYFSLDTEAEDGPEIVVDLKPYAEGNAGEDTGSARGRN